MDSVFGKRLINDEKILIQEIKLFHVFDDERGLNVLFVTNNDCVYGLGSNYWGSLGLGHNSAVNSPQIIRQLCHQNIKHYVFTQHLTQLSH